MEEDDSGASLAAVLSERSVTVGSDVLMLPVVEESTAFNGDMLVEDSSGDEVVCGHLEDITRMYVTHDRGDLEGATIKEVAGELMKRVMRKPTLAQG